MNSDNNSGMVDIYETIVIHYNTLIYYLNWSLADYTNKHIITFENDKYIFEFKIEEFYKEVLGLLTEQVLTNDNRTDIDMDKIHIIYSKTIVNTVSKMGRIFNNLFLRMDDIKSPNYLKKQYKGYIELLNHLQLFTKYFVLYQNVSKKYDVCRYEQKYNHIYNRTPK